MQASSWLASVSLVPRKCLASVSQAYCCVYVPALYAPMCPPYALAGPDVVRIHSPWRVLCNTYDVFAFMSQQKQCSAADFALCATHYLSVLSITQRHLHLGILWTAHHVSVLCIKRRKPAGEGCILRTTYPYYASRAESPRERAMYYALRIRIMYQALKAHPRELCTTHYVSCLLYTSPSPRD